jgi:hypothetical protein
MNNIRNLAFIFILSLSWSATFASDDEEGPLVNHQNQTQLIPFNYFLKGLSFPEDKSELFSGVISDLEIQYKRDNLNVTYIRPMMRFMTYLPAEDLGRRVYNSAYGPEPIWDPAEVHFFFLERICTLLGSIDEQLAYDLLFACGTSENPYNQKHHVPQDAAVLFELLKPRGVTSTEMVNSLRLALKEYFSIPIFSNWDGCWEKFKRPKETLTALYVWHSMFRTESLHAKVTTVEWLVSMPELSLKKLVTYLIPLSRDARFAIKDVVPKGATRKQFKQVLNVLVAIDHRNYRNPRNPASPSVSMNQKLMANVIRVVLHSSMKRQSKMFLNGDRTIMGGYPIMDGQPMLDLNVSKVDTLDSNLFVKRAFHVFEI